MDPEDVSTIHYSQYPIGGLPSCPNNAAVWYKTLTRQMTWSDLHIGCDFFSAGVAYNPDFPLGWMFTDG